MLLIRLFNSIIYRYGSFRCIASEVYVVSFRMVLVSNNNVISLLYFIQLSLQVLSPLHARIFFLFVPSLLLYVSVCLLGYASFCKDYLEGELVCMMLDDEKKRTDSHLYWIYAIITSYFWQHNISGYCILVLLFVECWVHISKCWARRW